MVHALDIGIELGFFKTLIQCTTPVTIEKFLKSVPCSAQFVPTWVHVMQSAGVIEVDQKHIIKFKDDWQEALTDEKSTIYAAGLTKCHLEIAKTYRRFSKIYKKQDEFSLVQHDSDLISALAADGKRFLNIFMNQVIDKIPHLQSKLDNGCILYEVGCGAGDFLINLARIYPNSQFTGIDLLKKAIDAAKTRNDEIGSLKNINFSNGCVTQLKESIADCITMIEVLHEIRPEIRINALEACRRALKADGIFFMIDILAPEDPIAYNSGRRVLSSLIQFFEAPWGSELVNQNQLFCLLKDAGFNNTQTIMDTDEIIALFATKE